MEKGHPFHPVVLEQVDIHMLKKGGGEESGHRSFLFHKNELKMDHKTECKTIR